LTVVLTVVLNMVTTRILVGKGPSVGGMAIKYSVFGVQYELILISFGLLFTAHFGAAASDRSGLSAGWITFVLSLFAALGWNVIWPQPSNWFTIMVPNIVGGITIAWSIHVVRGA
jgi:hypothetical protein